MNQSSFFSKVLVVIVLVGAGMVFGYSIRPDSSNQKQFSYSEVRANDNPNSSSTATVFTNPLLQCDIGPDYISNEVHPKRADIENVINQQKASGKITDASVYYRDLNNGPWVGINSEEKFFPASLMKLPVLFYFYKKDESDPTILDKKINGKNIVQDKYSSVFPSQNSIDPDKTYTINDLINSMIRYSDNKAATILYSVMYNNALPQLFSDLYIDSPKDATSDFITAKSYSTFFRILYNASYLSQANSEKALKLLSETDFNLGLKKYLPQNIVVAHKFGEREAMYSDQKQLHDCGIVYYPKHPYVLCVMTRGTNPNDMADSIGLISQSIYNAVDSQ